MSMNFETKGQAVAFVSMVMAHPIALMAPDFHIAMELSERFDIRAVDVLNHRKKKLEDDPTLCAEYVGR